MKCLFGHNFGKIEDRYQYCKKCGIAKPVPCNHEWKIIEKAKVHDASGQPYTIRKQLQCQKCGDLKSKDM